MSIIKTAFGRTGDGQAVELYTLTNRNGMKLAVSTYGAKLVQLWVPDREGKLADVITGFDTLDPYLIRNPYFGALVGRCANRISGASFVLNGVTYHLDENAPPHHLHGGLGGFDKKVFAAMPCMENGLETLKLTILSPDGDQGYPGNLHLEASYSLSDDNEVILHYRARSDAPTPVNITNHSYFNLAGHNAGTILDHEICIDADAYTPTGEGGIPLGTIQPVENTPMDLRQPVRIGERIYAHYPQLEKDGGFDVNYVLNRTGNGLQPVCRLKDPSSGRVMEVRTTLPGLQFYTANYIKGDFTFVGKGGYRYNQYCGLCLETQFHPNTPNIPEFGDITLRPGQEYDSTTVYAFSADGI